MTAEEAEARTMIREADLGVTRVYLDPWQYYLEPPADLVTPEYEEAGPMLWRYDGQQVFSDAPDDDRPVAYVAIQPDFVLTGFGFDADSYFGVGVQRRIDRYGRRWVLDYLDVAGAQALYEGKQVEDAAEFGPEPGVEAANPGIDYSDNPGEERLVGPTSWDTVNCSGADQYFDHSGNGDLVLATVTPMNERQRKIVVILYAGVLVGTGFMVDADSVLTAAHVLTDSAGNVYNMANYDVCSMENLDENTTGGHAAVCLEVADRIVYAGWDDDSPWETENDFAMLKLVGEPGNGWFELSSASDSAINGPTDYLRGYPSLRRTCAYNEIAGPTLTTDDDFHGFEMYSADGEVQGTPTGIVEYNTSVALGVSGGPHYYCPNSGGCGAGHYVTAVQSAQRLSCSGWDGVSYDQDDLPCSSGWVEGPKARDIEPWVDTTAIFF